MIEVGCYVSHLEFPPFDGFVVSVERGRNNSSKVAVYSKSEDRIIYDIEENWSVIGDQSDDNSSDEESDIIDADYKEI